MQDSEGLVMREGGVWWMLGEFGIWEVWVLLCDYSWDCWSRGSSTVVVVPCGLCWVQWDHSVWQCWMQTIWTLCAHRTFQKEILRKVWCRQSNSFGQFSRASRIKIRSSKLHLQLKFGHHCPFQGISTSSDVVQGHLGDSWTVPHDTYMLREIILVSIYFRVHLALISSIITYHATAGLAIDHPL